MQVLSPAFQKPAQDLPETDFIVNSLRHLPMKIRILSFLMLLLSSCKTYLEFTEGIKELDYSFENNKVKRYHTLKTALANADKVVFLDISFTSEKDPGKLVQELNANILKFPNLKKLTLLGDHKSGLPENILKLGSLEFLAINSITIDPNTDFSRLEKLRFLCLGDCRLEKIPASVLRLTNLQGIDLTGNEIHSIPEEASTFYDLRTIDLSNNNFSEIPEALKKCTHLKYMDFINSEGLDKEKLKTFHIGVNEIKTIGDLNEFRNLQGLSLVWAYPREDIASLRLKYPHLTIK